MLYFTVHIPIMYLCTKIVYLQVVSYTLLSPSLFPSPGNCGNGLISTSLCALDPPLPPAVEYPELCDCPPAPAGAPCCRGMSDDTYVRMAT